MAALGTQDGADDQYFGVRRDEARGFILHDLAFEIGNEVEQATDEPNTKAASVP